jgi:hypothetical protein
VRRDVDHDTVERTGVGLSQLLCTSLGWTWTIHKILVEDLEGRHFIYLFPICKLHASWLDMDVYVTQPNNNSFFHAPTHFKFRIDSGNLMQRRLKNDPG